MRRSFSTEVTTSDSLAALSFAASRTGFTSWSKKVLSLRNADRSSPICPGFLASCSPSSSCGKGLCVAWDALFPLFPGGLLI